MYIDSHTHFDLIIEETGGDEDEILRRMEIDGVARAVHVSVESGGFSWCRDFTARHRDRGLLFTIGIHPSSPAESFRLEEMKTFLEGLRGSPEEDLLFGIGECGLDYYRMEQPKESQTASFERQIAMAVAMNRPVIVHSREAWADTMKILKGLKPGRGVMHCFPGDAAMAREALDLNFHISFAGNVTYNRAKGIQEAAAFVPLDRILIETDAPFLSPVPKRGEKNRPEYIRHTYDFIAGLKKISARDLQEAVAANFSSILKMNSGG
jgi:TatD DNase family protein